METFISILFGILTGGLFLLSFWLEHETWRRISIILLLFLFIIISIVLDNDSYKKGQTDALKGKYNYEMKLSYEKRVEFSIQDSIVVDSNGVRLGYTKNGDIKLFYYQSYYPDTVWEVVFVPIDTQFVRK